MSKFKFLRSISLASMIVTAPALASQGQHFDTKFLFEGIEYKTQFNQTNVLADTRFVEVLQREMPLGRSTPNPNALSSVVVQNNQEEQVIDMVMAATEEVQPLIEMEPLLEGAPTSQHLDNALMEDFRKKKKRAMIKTLLRPLFLMTGELGVFGGGIAALNAAMPGTMALGIGIAGFVLLEVFSRNMSLCLNTIWYLFITPLGDPLTDLELRYACKKRFLSEQLQEKLERGFQDARKDDQTGSKKDYLDRILKLPVKSKKPKFDFRELQMICEGLEDNEGKPVAELIMVAIVNHMARYTERAGPNESPNMILYLEGPPGLGKTSLVKAITKSMQLSLVSLQVSDEHFKSTAQEPGALFQGVTSVPERNAVLFLDEYDRVANAEGQGKQNMLLSLIEPSTGSLRDDYIGQEFDISHYFRIIAGNHELKDKATLDRCIVVHVNKIDPQVKSSRIRTKMMPLIMGSEDPRLLLRLLNLSTETLNLIDRAIEQDKDAGFRKIQQTLQIILNKERLGKLE